MKRVVIERYAEPLTMVKGKPVRGQLYQTTYGPNGESETHKVGSSAPWATVKAHEETIRMEVK